MTEDDVPPFFPIPCDIIEGKSYAWCGCGKSTTEPLCDKTDCDKPVYYQADLTNTVYFCGCKQTKTPPFCDGSHAAVMRAYLKNRTSSSDD